MEHRTRQLVGEKEREKKGVRECGKVGEGPAGTLAWSWL